MRRKTILFTGGGSAGHVVPAMPLIDELRKDTYQVYYVGSVAGVERKIITEMGIGYYPIKTGKLRRYFSWRNFIDPINIILGFIQSLVIIIRLKPDLVFSKGGFVSVPIVLAAALFRKKILLHESDISRGLANRICSPFAHKVLLSFKDSDIADGKYVYTGTPVRPEALQGNVNIAKGICKFTRDKPVLMFIGGGNGSKLLNDYVKDNYTSLTQLFNIIHLTGHGKLLSPIDANSHWQAEYADAELFHLMSYSDIIVSRAGANTMREILSLRKPHIFIPISTKVSRGEQLANAKYFNQHYGSIIIEEEHINDRLLSRLIEISGNLDDFKQQLSSVSFESGTEKILEIIKSFLK